MKKLKFIQTMKVCLRNNIGSIITLIYSTVFLFIDKQNIYHSSSSQDITS